jgi:hypothetical protein
MKQLSPTKEELIPGIQEKLKAELQKRIQEKFQALVEGGLDPTSAAVQATLTLPVALALIGKPTPLTLTLTLTFRRLGMLYGVLTNIINRQANGQKTICRKVISCSFVNMYLTPPPLQDNTRPDQTRHDKTRPLTRPDQTRQDETKQGKTREGKTREETRRRTGQRREDGRDK